MLKCHCFCKNYFDDSTLGESKAAVCFALYMMKVCSVVQHITFSHYLGRSGTVLGHHISN